MTKIQILTSVGLIGLSAACAPADVQSADAEQETAVQAAQVAAPLPASSREADATASLINADGEAIGSALFYQGSNGVIMRLSVSGLAPGAHGMHFHAIGTCDDNDAGFKATGGHIMPLGKPHGFMHPEGPHAGNLPNLIVGDDGGATVELYTSLVSLSGSVAPLLDEDGSTLIIHENEDDHLTQPIGGAGGRVACGVVTAG